MTDRNILLQKIDRAAAEIQISGPCHRRDLQKYIRRLERELRRLDSRAER